MEDKDITLAKQIHQIWHDEISGFQITTEWENLTDASRERWIMMARKAREAVIKEQWEN